QLRFRFGGKRRYISLGLSDTPLNRRFAELKAAEIEQDIFKEKMELLTLLILSHQVFYRSYCLIKD
ncbi:MAG: DUF3596 domain-containing protein, partial [Waterburya sp.]